MPGGDKGRGNEARLGCGMKRGERGWWGTSGGRCIIGWELELSFEFPLRSKVRVTFDSAEVVIIDAMELGGNEARGGVMDKRDIGGMVRRMAEEKFPHEICRTICCGTVETVVSH